VKGQNGGLPLTLTVALMLMTLWQANGSLTTTGPERTGEWRLTAGFFLYGGCTFSSESWWPY